MIPTIEVDSGNSPLKSAPAFATPLGTSFARPKSSTFACPRFVTKIFAGLMSRWIIPSAWAASKASATWIQRLRVLRHVIWQEFQCNRALQARIDCLIDHAHSPCAQFFYDAKVRDGLVNHC